MQRHQLPPKQRVGGPVGCRDRTGRTLVGDLKADITDSFDALTGSLDNRYDSFDIVRRET